jgi:hypothetical protein
MPAQDRGRGDQATAALPEPTLSQCNSAPQAGREGLPTAGLHIVCDNYATHKHPTVKTWLAPPSADHPALHPTSGSWLNLVEIFFGIITRQAIRRGSFDSFRELTDAIRRFIDAWNQRCEPFVWTKDADTILAKARRSLKTKASAIIRH